MHDNNNNGLGNAMQFETSSLGFLTDSEKLRLLADWFDMKYPNDKNPEVQNDLRRIADNLDAE